METYTSAEDLLPNPQFNEQRLHALKGLDLMGIDKPIVDFIDGIALRSDCFTLQSCYGHFLYRDQRDTQNLDPLPESDPNTPISYRIAYIALCVKEGAPGRELLSKLNQIPFFDPSNVQFGTAAWFLERQVNTYIVQVEPERYKTQDSCDLDYREALHVEKVRERFFQELRKIFIPWL